MAQGGSDGGGTLPSAPVGVHPLQRLGALFDRQAEAFQIGPLPGDDDRPPRHPTLQHAHTAGAERTVAIEHQHRTRHRHPT